MELDDSEVRKPIQPPPAATRGYATTNSSGQIVAPEQFIADTRAFVGELGRSDKLSFAGACAVIISCFLPWKETAADGDVLGLMSMGVGSLLCSALVISAIFIRVRRSMPTLNPLVPWMTQVGVAFFCIIYTVVFIKVSFDSTEVTAAIGNTLIRRSTPSMGAFIGLLGSIAAMVGSVMGMRERV
jgi:hypothetical protein